MTIRLISSIRLRLKEQRDQLIEERDKMNNERKLIRTERNNLKMEIDHFRKDGENNRHKIRQLKLILDQELDYFVCLLNCVLL